MGRSRASIGIAFPDITMLSAHSNSCHFTQVWLRTFHPNFRSRVAVTLGYPDSQSEVPQFQLLCTVSQRFARLTSVEPISLYPQEKRGVTPPFYRMNSIAMLSEYASRSRTCPPARPFCIFLIGSMAVWIFVPPPGLEPGTFSLRGSSSTN